MIRNLTPQMSSVALRPPRESLGLVFVMQSEIWKAIPEYEGLYEVSNLGRVRSLDRNVVLRTGNRWHKRRSCGKVLSGGENGHGYKFVYIGKNGIISRYYVHRLVAEVFIPNPKNYPIINHKDENPRNNNADNLEWCTQKYNANYGGHIRRVREFMLSDKNPNRGRPRPESFKEKVRKPVIQFNKDGSFVKEWDSARTAGNTLGIQPQSITAVCRGRYHSYKNYIWKYKYDYPHTEPTKRNH